MDGTAAVYDIETNAIEDFTTLEGLKTVHCLVLTDMDTRETKAYGPTEIQDGLDELERYDILVGHNIVGFDLPALEKLYGFQAKRAIDTLLLSRMAFPEIKVSDFNRLGFPSKYIGSHSLGAWGQRLGCFKGDYGEQEDAWDEFTPEMLEYCKQDVAVNVRLVDHLPDLPRDAVELEHDFAKIIREQERNGFSFDRERAERLYTRLNALRRELREELQCVFPPDIQQMKTPAYWESPDGKRHATKSQAGKDAVRGPNKVKETPFNPDSRLQIGKRLIEKYDWKPVKFSDGGLPKIDETVLESLPYPEASKLARYLMLSKRIGQLAEGKEAWLKLEKQGRIHGRLNTLGAVTARCTHSKPNVSQVPAVRKPLGKACRSLFKASDGMVMLGADVSGLELRCLAHYMARWDEGRYAKILLEEDIHTANQKAAGLDTRDQAKTFIYAFLYGAGDDKIGSIIGGGMKEGRRMKAKFLKNIPALKYLRDAVAAKVKSHGHIKAIDGRPIPIRSQHAALNTLLQSCGAIIVKRATVIAANSFCNCGMWGSDVRQVAHIHDEIQYEVKPEVAELAGGFVVESIVRSGEYYNLRCPLDGEYKIGKNWKDTH